MVNGGRNVNAWSGILSLSDKSSTVIRCLATNSLRLLSKSMPLWLNAKTPSGFISRPFLPFTSAPMPTLTPGSLNSMQTIIHDYTNPAKAMINRED